LSLIRKLITPTAKTHLHKLSETTSEAPAEATVKRKTYSSKIKRQSLKLGWEQSILKPFSANLITLMVFLLRNPSKTPNREALLS
jgi:hypothetical protein